MAAGEATAVIGKSVQIRGEVKGNEDLVVEGLVEGTITLSGNRLTVGQHARVKANVMGRDVIVLGALEGDVQATGRVELRAGSHMTGDIRAARLSVEDNAVYSGKVELDGTGGTAEGGKSAGQATARVDASSPAAAH
ncbi:MAG TPA: polymer-forming cytoskeletal protein [Acidobacteriaceae bacterium]|jgi:cytoskeletal protein CcmA (bactofilin family)|nr:polymer-forming cytoskeletal protein [Acidobacteriaceae bacterium]